MSESSVQASRPAGVALVIGAGDATGGAIARRFAQGGYTACLTRRSADQLEPLVQSIRADGGQAFGYGSDARKEEEVAALFEQIEATHQIIAVEEQQLRMIQRQYESGVRTRAAARGGGQRPQRPRH